LIALSASLVDFAVARAAAKAVLHHRAAVAAENGQVVC
jgi:hypothetical protein